MNCSPAVGTNAAIAMKRASARSSRQLGNDEGYRSSRVGVSGCFTRWPRVLLNDLVGRRQKRFRDGEAEGFGGLQIDRQLEFGWLLDR